MNPTSSPSRFGLVPAVLTVVGLLLGLAFALSPQAATPASAANANDFRDGYIISDAHFFDSGSMSAGEIQAFLNSKVTTCRGANGMPCLKDYVAQETPQLPANNYCKAYPGGTMSAAQLIATVSQTCGISPKVILVMLQKEQSLITSTSPTRYNYSAALGQGCPDGAPCDPAFAGFFYQIYGAAKQMQVYIKNPRLFGYQLGWNNILYQATPPDYGRVCGTKRVFIENDATRALYIYTPYTPNQAALNNLYGEGDFCSSYGNRNFWRLFTDWFGSPTGYSVHGAYADVWSALGGANGILGEATGAEVCDGRYCQQSFRGGAIYWFPGRGVFGVPSTIDRMWHNLGFFEGAAGKPTGVVVCNPDGTCTQSFDGGVIAADASGGSLVGRHVESAWVTSGGISLGAARGPEVCTEGRCAQLFARGALFSGGPATSVVGAMFTAWNAAGLAEGPLGHPTADAGCSSVGCMQMFGGGIIVSASGRAEAVPEPIASRYVALGGLKSFGGPMTPATCDELGQCSQRFASARFDSSASRVIVTTGWFLNAWATVGYEKSRLGLPLAEMVCTTVACYQPFAGGTLSGSASNTVVAVYGAYRDVWMAAGGPTGSLGLPVGGEKCNGSDCSQIFQGGTVVWTPAHGAVTLSGWFLAPWQAQGSGLGRLGAPTGGMVCTAVTCYQPFVGGTLTGSASGSIVAVHGAYRDVWMAAGGPMGALGLPLRGETCSSTWCSTEFERGLIVWSQATGAVAVVTPIREAWAAAGGAAGRYGLPIAPATESDGAATQRFQQGTISVP